MSKLKAIHPKAAALGKPKILVFGKPGVGKTWAAIDFPSCYFIDTEGGASLPHYTDKLDASGGVYLGKQEGSQSFKEVFEQVKALATERHDYKTLVIDSITKLFYLEIAEEAERLLVSGKKNEFSADRKPAVRMLQKLIVLMEKLDMNVILIAHEKSEWGNVGGERVEIGNTFDCWERLEYELHLCVRITKQGQSRKAFVRKSRLEAFPDASSFDWSYAAFAERYGRDIMESSAVPVTLATPAQVAEFRKLVGQVKLGDGKNDLRIIEIAPTIDEMESGKIENALNYLRSLAGPKTQPTDVTRSEEVDTLPDLSAIHNATSLETLKTAFSALYKAFPGHRIEITEAKEAAKTRLSGPALHPIRAKLAETGVSEQTFLALVGVESIESMPEELVQGTIQFWQSEITDRL